MKFETYYAQLDTGERLVLAQKLKTSPAYLYQIASGRRQAGAKFLLNIETATGGRVTPQDLRQSAA